MSDTPPPALPYAFGGPAGRGRIKQRTDDFIVEEILGFVPSGDGEHVFLRIEKCGENTDHIARLLARHAGLPRTAVSYAGMKDRHGRTIQWFSVHVPGKRDIDWSGFDSDTVRILEQTRNSRKLKKGVLKGNRFDLTLRELDGDRAAIESRLQTIAAEGVPNYFGPQRFGRNGQNVEQARLLFRGELKLRDRHMLGIYLSAARAHLFNSVLARRVSRGDWNRAICGDVFMFADSHSFFRDAITADIERRIAELAIHPSGPLWGKGPSPAADDALAIEQAVAAELADISEGLVTADLDMARRPLRMPVSGLSWEFPDDHCLKLRFDLPAGAYATTVLREVIAFDGELD